MIYLENDCWLPEGRHNITGKLEEIIIANNEIEEVCKNIIKNEFMSEVNDWGCSFENLLDPDVGMGDTYVEVLYSVDWNCKKYYVQLDDNNARLFKVIDIKEESDDDIFDIRKNDDGTFDFHVRFECNDDISSLSHAIDNAVDKCSLK